MLAEFIEILPTGLLQSLILSFLVIGVMIPFKVLDFPDLTVEGSYPFGAALCALMIASGSGAFTSLISATLLSGLLGIATSFIHLRYRINSLLAGIIVSTMIYSINLRIMGGPNIALFNYETLFNSIQQNINLKLLMLAITNLLIASMLVLFFNSEKGLRFRVVGSNKKFAEKQGINVNYQIYAGLFLSSCLCGLSGAIMAQMQNYVDIGMGAGIAIYALASLMIGEKIINFTSTSYMIAAPIIGAITYGQLQGIALSAGLAPTDLKFMTGIVVLATLSLKSRQQ